MRTSTTALALAGAMAWAGAAGAQDAPAGDAEAGETAFNRQCVACHVVQDEAGEVLAGRSAQTGPNLYGVAGRVAGSLPDYDYSEILALYGEQGATWEEANFVPYVQDPTGFLQEATGDNGRGKMTFRVRDEQDALDLWAFLAGFGGAEGAEAAAEDEAPAEGEAEAAPSE